MYCLLTGKSLLLLGRIELLLGRCADMAFLCLVVEPLVPNFSWKQGIEVFWPIKFSLLSSRHHRKLGHYGFGGHRALHFNQIFIVEEIEIELAVGGQEIAATLERFCQCSVEPS